MRKILVIILCGMALSGITSCSNKGGEVDQQDALANEYADSIATVSAEKDSLMALLTEISDGMTQIKDMEQLLNTTNLNGETPDRRNQIKNDMLLLQQALEDRREKLEALEERLKKSKSYTDQMRKTVESLKSQLAVQQTTISDLNQKLADAKVTITRLSGKVDSLATENVVANDAKVAAEQESQRLNNELNTCFYVIGSKNELKATKIIETGFLRKTKIMAGDFEKSYFTKADKRTLNEVTLHSKKAKVLTNHPAGSYQIVDYGGMKSLRIVNPTQFWSLGNYLVVQVD